MGTRGKPRPEKAGQGQRSVWEFPRPPAIEAEPRSLRIVFGGEQIAYTTRGVRVLETSHPPVYFFPPEDVRMDRLVQAGRGSFCEWKGEAAYFDVSAGERNAPRTAFAYPDPTPRFRKLAGWLSFYAGPMDGCWVGDEPASPQPGEFYSGWVTADVVGPFKGVPGSAGW